MCLPPPPLISKSPTLSHKIIVSLTTYKNRIHYVHYALDSLYHQTLRPSEVRLYVAKGEYKTLPAILEKFKPWLQVIEVRDIGSYKKFIPALKSVKENELIVSLDDDFLYPPHLIASLYELFLKYPYALIGYCGFRNDKPYFESIAGGFGILWNPEIFHPDKMAFFFDEELFFESIGRNLDDAWIALSCLEQGIEMVCCSDDYVGALREFVELPSGAISPISRAGEGSCNYISKEEKARLKHKMLEMIRENLGK